MDGLVAHSVVCRTLNPEVPGSNPGCNREWRIVYLYIYCSLLWRVEHFGIVVKKLLRMLLLTARGLSTLVTSHWQSYNVLAVPHVHKFMNSRPRREKSGFDIFRHTTELYYSISPKFELASSCCCAGPWLVSHEKLKYQRCELKFWMAW